MHLHAEKGRALLETDGHNQADETSFIIHSHGQLLALDPGYLSWGRRNELGNAQNHNMVLINGVGPSKGEPGNTNGAE
ncbi:MAG: heparinase II/III-family protein, partial [Bacteroidota bacterium]|nr:heparinase II/III-family protein [Bacteroidota bacterium]